MQWLLTGIFKLYNFSSQLIQLQILFIKTLAITLVGGRVQLTFDTGSGAAFTRAVLPLTLERWHHIAFNITGTQGTLQVVSSGVWVGGGGWGWG